MKMLMIKHGNDKDFNGNDGNNNGKMVMLTW